MEVGVFNGENAKSMIDASELRSPPREVEYYGFDFFQGSSLSEVERKLEGTGCRFKLFKGDTLYTIPKAVTSLPKMDLIFIDGGKSYREAESDWENCRSLMHERTAVFVHNYEFSGVKRMVNGISGEHYDVKILHPSHDSDTAFIKKTIKILK
jgi:predicted O-methyltransferase YrrM